MSFSDVFDSLRRPPSSGLTSMIDRLEDQLESEKRIKKAYLAALVEACNGDKVLAKKLARKHLARASS